jgi:hypothetical protein
MVPDMNILKSTLKLMGFLYLFFTKVKYAISCFEKMRDVSLEDEDIPSLMFAYK